MGMAPRATASPHAPFPSAGIVNGRRRGGNPVPKSHPMKAVWALALCALVTAGCQGADVEAKKANDFVPGEIRLSPQLLQSGQFRIEPVTAGGEAITVRTSGKAGFNEEQLSYVSSPLVGRIVDIRARPGQARKSGV
jgi:hypothetical protein